MVMNCRPRWWLVLLRGACASWLMMLASFAAAAEPLAVWADVDTATGLTDVDDGLMLLQCFHSPELRLVGVSVVFGNAPLAQAVPIARTICEKFGPRGLSVSAGAARADQLGSPSPAVEALASALRQEPLTILAVGPVTNIATLIQLHPELLPRIQRIVVVAGRRPGQKFISSEMQKQPHRDFNFELDPRAMQVLLDSTVPLVLAPWEVSSHVWLTHDDLALLAGRSAAGKWIAESSAYWIKLWERQISSRGFNPFDTLAAGWLTHPELIDADELTAHIESLPDDRDPTGAKSKPYLLVEDVPRQGRRVTYCHTPRAAFHDVLVQRLAGPGDGPQ